MTAPKPVDRRRPCGHAESNLTRLLVQLTATGAIFECRSTRADFTPCTKRYSVPDQKVRK